MLTVCNRCGKNETNETNEYEQYQNINLMFDYGSKHDMEDWNFNLCDDCLIEIIRDFKFVPKGFKVDNYIQLTKEQHQSIFEDWKRTGKWEEFNHIPYDEFKQYKELFSDDYYEEILRKYYPAYIEDKDKTCKVKRIILNGRGGSGKDEFADYLVENYGFKKLAFADGIYDIARRYFGMTYKDRVILQKIGEKMREIDPMIWVNYTFEKAKKYDKVVISDCRRANEYQVGLKSEFLPIRIEADLDKRIKRLEKRDGFYPDLSLLENESETGADSYDFITTDNNSDFEHLYEQIDEIMSYDWTDYIETMQMEYQMKQMY